MPASEGTDVPQLVLGDDHLLAVGLKPDCITVEARLEARSPALQPLHFGVLTVKFGRMRGKRILQIELKKCSSSISRTRVGSD